MFTSNRETRRLAKQRDIHGLVDIACDKGRPGRERRMAVVALGDLGDGGAVDGLVPLLRDFDVRGLTAETLGKIGDFRAAGPIYEVRNSRNARVRASCEKALGMFMDMDTEACKRAIAQWSEEMDDGVERLAGLISESVSTWDDCPMCRVPLSQGTEHVGRCGRCDRYFCDDGWAPRLSLEKGSLGELLGESSAGLLPAEMIESLGFRPITMGGSLGACPVGLVFRLNEDYNAAGGKSLMTDGVLMRHLAQALAE